MRISLWLVLFTLIAGTSAQAQSSQSRVAGQNQISIVPKEVLLIEEETLPLDSSLQAGKQAMNNLSGSNAGAVSLKEDSGTRDNGLKLFKFTLAPGEKLTTKVVSDVADGVTQRYGVLSGPSFTPSSASNSQISRINRLNRQQRATQIEFKNLEDRPFPLLLIIYGQVGHPYKIQISRDPGI